ncbi:hypothetical protein YIM73052_22060, partial [Thermus antranikianii]
ASPTWGLFRPFGPWPCWAWGFRWFSWPSSTPRYAP